MSIRKADKNLINFKEKTCAICIREYVQNENILTTPCEHEYHYNCIRVWFRTNNSCPICKFKIVKENLILKPCK